VMATKNYNKQGGLIVKTLSEYNKERVEFYRKNVGSACSNNIACPKCEYELCDSSPNITLAGHPPQKNIHCVQCGFTGLRIA